MPKKYSMIDESNNGLLYGIIYVFRIYSLIVETRLLKEAYVIFDGQIDLFVSVINMANGLHWHHWKMPGACPSQTAIKGYSHRSLFKVNYVDMLLPFTLSISDITLPKY